jgi:hypothetical protein
MTGSNFLTISNSMSLFTETLPTAGPNADHRRPSAKAADHEAQGLLSTEVPHEPRDLDLIRKSSQVETKDNQN